MNFGGLLPNTNQTLASYTMDRFQKIILTNYSVSKKVDIYLFFFPVQKQFVLHFVILLDHKFDYFLAWLRLFLKISNNSHAIQEKMPTSCIAVLFIKMTRQIISANT